MLSQGQLVCSVGASMKETTYRVVESFIGWQVTLDMSVRKHFLQKMCVVAPTIFSKHADMLMQPIYNELPV